MTAKDEDILTSKSLLKKGVAIDRFLQNIIVDKDIKLDYDKIQIDGIGIDKFEPLIWDSKDNEVHIFEHESTEYNDIRVDQEWLIQRFYEFGFLNEWGSFAGEFHVSGTVEINAVTGEYKMPYNQSVEQYDSHESEGSMFDEIKRSDKN